MKYLFSIIIISLSLNSACAQNLERFWDSVRTNNSEFVDYQKNQSNLKNKSLDAFLPIKKASARFYGDIKSQAPDISAKLSSMIFGCPTFKNIIFFDDEYQPNAGIDANGNLEVGVTLYGLLDDDEFLSIMAHEAAHLALKHHEIGHFAQTKNERDNKALAAVVSGLYTASVIYGESYRAANTGYYSSERLYGTIPTSIAISESFMRSIEFQTRLYSRDQEIEADFTAAAYLDYVGIGRAKFISALTKVRKYYADLGYNTKKMGKNSTHPSIDERIGYIEKNRRPSFDFGMYN